MFEIRNKTPFVVTLLPTLDKQGADQISVLVKATYSFAGKTPEIAEKQVPVHMADVPNGEDPAASSIKYQSDACPTKPATDVVLVGHAYAPNGRAPTVDVALEVGPLRKNVRVTGDRVWTRALGWVMSRPVPFEQVPLVYERAFGGWDRSHPDPAQHAGDERNPVGTGFAASNRAERLEGLHLPNLEAPDQPVKDWKTRPPVAGFGFIGRAWLPRRTLAGTYDDAWQEERAPLLPPDFDDRYFNGAPVDLQARPHLRGGERVRLLGVSPRGLISTTLPAPQLDVALSIRREIVTPVPVLDTVVIEPDESRLVLSYRATVPCPRRLIHVEAVSVKLR